MQIADIFEGLLRQGQYYQPEATPEVPYPVRHRVTSPFYDPSNHGSSIMSVGSVPDPTPDQKLQGRGSRVPDLTTSNTSTSAPGEASGATAGGSSLPSFNDMSEMASLFI